MANSYNDAVSNQSCHGISNNIFNDDIFNEIMHYRNHKSSSPKSIKSQESDNNKFFDEDPNPDFKITVTSLPLDKIDSPSPTVDNNNYTLLTNRENTPSNTQDSLINLQNYIKGSQT
jgi:hypothetical protein